MSKLRDILAAEGLLKSGKVSRKMKDDAYAAAFQRFSQRFPFARVTRNPSQGRRVGASSRDRPAPGDLPG